MTDWLSEHKLDELVLEGGLMYVYHPDGCNKAPSLTLRELLDLSKRMSRVLRELAGRVSIMQCAECHNKFLWCVCKGHEFSEDAKGLCVAAKESARE